MKTYFVSYHVSFPIGSSFGMCDVQVNHLHNMSDINALSGHIKSKIKNAGTVIILNWKEIEPAPEANKG